MDFSQEFEKADKLIELGRFKEARVVAQNMLAAGHEEEAIYYLLALCDINLGNLDSADQALTHCLQLDAEFAPAFNLKGHIEMQRENFKKAEAYAQESIRLYPDDADTFYLLAQIQVFSRQSKKALDSIERGLRIEPEHAELLQMRSVAQFQTSGNVDGIASLKEALEKDPNNSHSLALYAFAQMDLGNYKKAKEHFISALQQDPTNEFARQGLAEIYKTRWWVFRIFYQYGFSRWKFELKGWRVVLFILMIKSIAIWGGFFLLFLLFTWWGDVLFNSVLRLGKRSKHLLSPQKIQQSNFFLLFNFIAITSGIAAYYLESYALANVAIFFTLTLFVGIALLEVELERQRKSISIAGGIFISITCLAMLI